MSHVDLIKTSWKKLEGQRKVSPSPTEYKWGNRLSPLPRVTQEVVEPETVHRKSCSKSHNLNFHAIQEIVSTSFIESHSKTYFFTFLK